MKNNFDNFTNTITQPDVFLCHRNYDVICPLTPITDLKIYEAANSYDEITFSFNRVNNGVEFEYWDKLKSLKVVKVKNADEEKYFEIAVDVSDEESTIKNVTGISMEGELAQISIGAALSINGETDRDNDSNWENNTYISTVIHKASDTDHSLLHRILSYAPHWKIGHVDSHVTDPNTNQLVETSSVVRTFEFSNTNVYDALQEVAKELDVVFIFDSKTRSVNMYDLNTVGEDTTVFVNKENLANSFTCSSNKDSIKNCFKVTGGDDLINSYVRSVNPNGSEYIYYISKDQREDMSDELVAKLDAYDALYESQKTGYENACAEMFAAIDDVQKYTNTLAPQRTDATTTALDEYNKLKNIASVYVQSKKNLLQKGVEKAILTLAQITVDYRYTITIQDEDTYDEVNSIWTGKFKVVNESNDEDVVVGTDDVTISILEDEKTSLQNQIDKLIGDGDFEDAAVDELREKYIDKDPKDYDYCQERLQEMWKVYAECANVLLEKGYAVKKDDNKFYSLYSEYHQKEQILSTAYLNMTNYIESLEKIKEEKAKQVNAYHDELDFVKFLGDKLYKEFCCYRREDVYENSNYISDGLSDKEAIEKAKTLIEVATKELYKASLFQYTYTANLNNLFNNSVFKPFWEHFALFNWIRAEVDERVISLRLIGITYDYANPDKIEVEFSEQVRNANGITDLESILNQAKSMATSYSSTAKQASQGAESYSDFKTLKEEGLNSALMNIKNSNNEEITVDGRGINCRSKDINDDYDQCQLRITGKNIVMTDDDWNSAGLAIGRGLFNGQEKYGVWCDVLVGNIVASETLMISNGSKTFIVDKDSIIVNNMKLDMYSADKKHRLLIDPNLKSMFNIYNEDNQVFFIDVNGNVTMKGNLYINNGNTYLKADMDDENIIEIGTLPDPFGYSVEQTDIKTYLSDNQLKTVSLRGYKDSVYYAVYHNEKNELYYWDSSSKSWAKEVDNPIVDFYYKDNYYSLCLAGDGIYHLHLYCYSSDLKTLEKTLVLEENSYYTDADSQIPNYILYNNYMYIGYIGGFPPEYSINLDTFEYTHSNIDLNWDNFTETNPDYYVMSTPFRVNTGYDGKLYFAGTVTDYTVGTFRALIEYDLSNLTSKYILNIYDYIPTDNDASSCYSVQIKNQVHIFCNTSSYPAPADGSEVHLVYDISTGNIKKVDDVQVIKIDDYCDTAIRLDDDTVLLSVAGLNYCYKLTNNSSSSSDTSKLFYVTNDGQLYIKGDIYARSLTLGSDVSIDTSKITGLDDKLKDIENDFSGVNNDLKNVIYKGDITTTTEKLDNGIIKTTNRVPSGTDADGNVIYEDSVTYTSADGNYVMTDIGLGDKEKENGHYVVISKDGLLEAINATIAGTIYAGAGKIAGWDITDLCLSSEMYDDFENYSGIKLTSDGNIYTRGKYFNPEGYWAKLYSGKWIFSFGDGSIFDTSKGYCDISAAGIYIASRQTIETPESRYLFNVDVLNDVVKIESSSNNPALSINNNSDGTCLEVRNNSSTYENKALSIGVTVVNTDDNGNNSTGMGYITVFGEGIAGSAGRIIMRPDQNIKSTDTVNPANYTNSACGTYYYPWGTMSCIQLYVDKTSTTSDAKLKTPIKLIDGDIALKFINGLIPREYYLNNSENKRHHMGFYAQEVSQLAKNLNLGDMAIYEAIVSKDGDETEYYYDPNVDDEHLHWSLNYNEFIAPLVGSVQELVKRDKENKERINKLENTVETLLEEVKSLKEQISNQ